MADLSLHHISKRFGRGPNAVEALNDVSLTVHDGELLAIVGPSGCGKTTMLRLIAGLDDPTGGEIRLAGRNVIGLQPRDRHVAMVFQDFPLYPHMTVRKNMAFPLKNRKLPRAAIDQRVKETAATLGFAEQLDRYPRELSGGERQRVALGRALAVQPACLLLDEPLSNLDARLRAALRAEIKSLHQRLKATIIHITHDQEEAMMLGDRIAVMRRGSIQQVGTPMEVYGRPANRFVAEFIAGAGSGSIPMNFLEGVVAIENGRLAIHTEIAGTLHLNGKQEIACSDHSSRTVSVGIRPEDVRLEKQDTNDRTNQFEVEIAMIEPIGDRMNVHARVCNLGRELVVVSRSQVRADLEVGDRVTASIDATAIHLFESGADGARIGL